MTRVNCIGVLVVDALSGPLESYPIPRRRTQVITRNVRFFAGGGAANTAGALGRMGINAGVFSKVGRDSNGEFLRRELAHSGVDTAGICVSRKDTTPFTFVGVHSDGERTFIHTPGANKTFCRDDLRLNSLFKCNFLLYQDLWALPRLDGGPGARLLADAQRRGIITLLDECWGLGPNREKFEKMLPHCDYVLPSADDMRVIYPGLTDEEIAGRILGRGAKAVILKLGAKGCLVARDGMRKYAPAFRAKVVDTTGAGDCWNAGFIAGLARGEDVLSSARLGNACASFCVGAIGGTAGIPNYETVSKRAER